MSETAKAVVPWGVPCEKVETFDGGIIVYRNGANVYGVLTDLVSWNGCPASFGVLYVRAGLDEPTIRNVVNQFCEGLSVGKELGKKELAGQLRELLGVK